MAQAPEFTNPYKDEIARYIAEMERLKATPVPEMYSPEQATARQGELQRGKMFGHLGILSGDPMLTGIGKPMLAEAIKASERKQTEHGEFDPVSGQFKYFPQYQRQREEERTQKSLERAENLGAAAEFRWAENRQKAEDAKALRQTIAALKKSGGDPGSLSYAGTHPETGKPILLHSKGGMFYEGKPYGGPVAEKPQGATATEREDVANLDTNIVGLTDSIMSIDKVITSGGGTFTGIIPGTIADLHPTLQAIVTSFKSDEEKNAASMAAYISDGIRSGRFGLTLTPHEKASSVQYLPSPYDSLDELKRKSVGLKTLLERDRTNRVGMMQRPGLAPAPYRAQGATGVPGEPARGVVRPAAPALPPGWSIKPKTP